MTGAHPTTIYNRQRPQSLIGNWYEERALEQATGKHRYTEWTMMEPSGSVYAERCAPSGDEVTSTRVLEHSEQDDPAEWTTQQRAAHIGGYTQDHTVFYEGEREGKRRMKLMQQLMERAKEPEPEPEPERHLETTLKEDFPPQEPPDEPRGRRVMMTQDHEEIPLSQRDDVLLLEHGVEDRRLTRSKRGMGRPAERVAGHYSTDLGVTIHSQRLEEGKQPELTTVPSKSGPSGTFGRECNFTRPLDHPKKRIETE